MPKVKLQHYVPQFYLRKFANQDEQVFVFDKFGGKVFRTSVRNVGGETHFYDFSFPELPIPDEYRQGVDRALEVIDNDFAAITKDLEDQLESCQPRLFQKPVVINEAEKSVVAYYLAVQMLRTKEFRNYCVEFSEKMMKAMADLIIEEERPDLAGGHYTIKLKDEFIPLEHAGLLFHPNVRERMVPILANHIWTFAVNLSSRPLYTSDNPIVKRPHKVHPVITYDGFGAEGIEIAFPISPNYLLVMWERQYFSNLVKDDRTLDPCIAENVTYYNSLQVFRSHRYIFCPTDDFDLVRRMLVKHPVLRSPGVGRVQFYNWKKQVWE